VFAVLDLFCIYKACTKSSENYPEFDDEEAPTTQAGDREGLI